MEGTELARRGALFTSRSVSSVPSCFDYHEGEGCFQPKDVTSGLLECRETAAFQDRAARRIVPDDLVGNARRKLALLVRGGGFAPLDNPTLEGLFGLPLAFRLSARRFRWVFSCRPWIRH